MHRIPYHLPRDFPKDMPGKNYVLFDRLNDPPKERWLGWLALKNMRRVQRRYGWDSRSPNL